MFYFEIVLDTKINITFLLRRNNMKKLLGILGITAFIVFGFYSANARGTQNDMYQQIQHNITQNHIA